MDHAGLALMRPWLPFVLLALLAGCSEPGASRDESSMTTTKAADAGIDESADARAMQTEDGPAAAAARSYRGSFELLVNPDTEVIGLGGASQNCVFFWDSDGTDLGVLNGTARLTWAPGPTTTSFRIITATTVEDAASAYGGSPVEWSFGTLTPGNPQWGVGFGADYTLMDGTLPIALPMTLDLEFSYTGDLPEAGIGTCAGGGV
jgi:hypothetical protein